MGVYFTTLTPSDLRGIGTATVGAGAEFVNIADPPFNFSGATYANSTADIGGNLITVSYPESERGFVAGTYPFNGLQFKILTPGPAITGVAILPGTNAQGLTLSDLTFNSQTLDVNLSGIVLPRDVNGSIQLSVQFGLVPIPATLPLLASALGGLGLFARRRVIGATATS